MFSVRLQIVINHDTYLNIKSFRFFLLTGKCDQIQSLFLVCMFFCTYYLTGCLDDANGQLQFNSIETIMMNSQQVGCHYNTWGNLRLYNTFEI